MASAARIETITETVQVVDGLALRLAFDPDSIRQHFDGSDQDALDGLTDDQLAEVAALALNNEALYDTFHDVLSGALADYRNEQAGQ